MKICFPIRDLNGKEFTSVDEVMSLINSEAHGTWLLGANGLWHGGIHISDITQPFSALNKDAQNDSDPIPLQFMADGTVVAYRVNDVYQTAPYCGKPLRFSSSFVLVKSVCQPDPAKNESWLEFYSLYMHLAAVEDYPKSPCYKVSAGHNGISVRKYIKGNYGVPEAESSPQYSAAYNAPAAVGGIKVNEGDRFVVSRTGRFYVTRSRETKLLTFGLSRLLKDGKLSKEQYWITLDAGLMERNGEIYDLMPGWMNQAVAKGVFNSVVNTDGSDVWKVSAGSPVGFMGLNEVPGVGQLVEQERFVHLEVVSTDSKMPAFLSNPASVTTGGKLVRTIAGKKMHLRNGETNPPTFTASEVALARGALVSRESTSPVKDASGKWWFKVSDNGWMPQADVEEIEQYDLLKQGFYPLAEDSDGDIMHTFMEGWVSEAFGQVAEVSEGNNSGPLSAREPDYYRTMMGKLDENKDGKISADEIRRALSRRDPQVRNIIDRLVIKHHSEWIGGPSEERWKGFYKILDKLSIPYCTKWQSGHEWMSKVDAFKAGKPIWHMHPISFLNALAPKSNCACNRNITFEELKEICAGANDDVIRNNLDAINQGFTRFEINTCRGKSHFLAQVLHESGYFRYTSEIGGGNASYQPWYGRGLIQVTLKANYLAYGAYIGEDVSSNESNRGKLTSPPHSVLSAFWFYKVHKSLDTLAQHDDFNKITAIINGGYNGYDDRLKIFKKSIKILNGQHLSNLIVDETFTFESSEIYNSKIYSFGWGLWHDPSSSRHGVAKNRDNALSGYRRSKQLLEVSPFPQSQHDRKIYGVKYGELMQYLNGRIQALEGGL